MKKSIRKSVLLALKIALAVALLAWVLSSVHWSDYVVVKGEKTSYDVVKSPAAPDRPNEILVRKGRFWKQVEQTLPRDHFEPIPNTDTVVRVGFLSSLGRIRVPLLVVAVIGFVLSYLVVAVRWWLLMRIQDIRLKLWEVVRLTFLGLFFNSVVPGTVGGDLIKAYYAAKHTPKRAAVLVSIFVDRVLGLTELSGLAAVMILIVWAGGFADMSMLGPAAVTIAVVLAGLAFAFLVVFSRRFRHTLRIQKIYERTALARHIWAAGDAVAIYKQRYRQLLLAILITFGAHILWVGSIGLIGVSLSLEVDFYRYFIYIPLIYIIGAVPVTPGGVGVIEKFYVVFFAAALVSPSQVLVLALLARLIPIFWSLPGALVAITGPKLPRAAAMEAELGLGHAGEPTPE